MSIKIAKTAGFCYGVKRAVDEVYKRVEAGEDIGVLGELIHNHTVIEDLQKKNVATYYDIDEVEDGKTLIIRTHGVKKAVIDKIEEKGIKYIDLTCPFVAKIHKIVNEHHKNGEQILIVGDENHPEVIGINGWCEDEAIITYDTNFKITQNLCEKDICIVAQTTINKEIFGQIVQNVENTCKSVVVFDTICNATKDRQAEADALSAESDVMFVVGGKKSSNTAKLFEIAKANCPQTYFIETSADIPADVQIKNRKIGITAGASTPGCIIEEVFTTMDEKMTNEESFAELLAQSESKTLHNGDIIDGTVVEVRPTEIIVDLGGFKYNGQLAADQLSDDPYAKVADLVKPGDTIKVYVVGVNDAEGKVVLSRKKIVAMESWNKMKEAYENKEILNGKFIKVVNGGIIALVDQTQVFVPARHASLRFVQDLTTLLNTEVRLRLIDMDERKKRFVGSVRNVLEEEKKAVEDAFWASAEVGKEYTGAVKSLTSFGAFVDLGGVDGLVHISELSWGRIKHPSEVVKEGDVVTVYIKDLNAETKKISLGYKKAEDNPWLKAQNELHVDDVIKCKVVRLVPFGAFCNIMPYVDGLIHISQIADKRIAKPDDVLTVGEEVEAKITAIDWETKKISLSIRALIAPPVEEVKEEEAEPVAPVIEEDAPVDVEKFIAEEAAEANEETVEETAEEAVEETVAEEPAQTVSEDAE